MKWGRYPFTNIIGERSIRLKPEGSDFEIIGNAQGIRFVGESPFINTGEELDELAKNVAEAYKFYQWAMREKHGLKAKPEEKVKELITEL